VLLLTIGIAIRADITRSVWDPAATVVRWFALGYGLYLLNRLLPVYVAHGRTRREYLRSIAVFVAGAGAVVAALLTLGLALEAVLYRVMEWPQRVAPERLFDAPDQYPLIFLSYWGHAAGLDHHRAPAGRRLLPLGRQRAAGGPAGPGHGGGDRVRDRLQRPPLRRPPRPRWPTSPWP
jgi:hypothetical protein